MSDRPDRITVRFSVLGPVSIDDGARTVILPSAKPVSLLAAMLLRPNKVEPVDYLQSAVWGENAADTTKATLQAYRDIVADLRSATRAYPAYERFRERRPLQQLELAILRGEELARRPWAESRIRIGEVL